MNERRRERVRASIRTAGGSGRRSAVELLYATFIVLINTSHPGGPLESLESLRQAQDLRRVRLALTLMPFAGIAFLWFVGVVRDRIGDQEDRFFFTIFFGSGLLFIAMSFVAAAVGGGLVASLAADAERTIDSGIAAFGRAITYNVTHVYAIRMAAVFMISLATVWLRTGSLPRLTALVTYLLALLLLLGNSISLWPVLAFPAWVLVISLEHLIRNLPHKDLAVTPAPA